MATTPSCLSPASSVSTISTVEEGHSTLTQLLQSPVSLDELSKSLNVEDLQTLLASAEDVPDISSELQSRPLLTPIPPPLPPILASASPQSSNPTVKQNTCLQKSPRTPTEVQKESKKQPRKRKAANAKVTLEEIKSLFSSEIKDMKKSINQHFDSILDNPATGVLTQLKTMNSMLTHPQTGMKTIIEDHTGKINVNTTNIAVLTSRVDSLDSSVMDTLDASIAPMKLAVNSITPLEARVVRLEQLPTQNEGMEAISTKITDLQNEVNHPVSGLTTKVQTLQLDLQNLSSAIEKGEHEIVLKTQTPEITDQLVALHNTITSETGDALATLKADTTTQLNQLKTDMQKVTPAPDPATLQPAVDHSAAITDLQNAIFNHMHNHTILEGKIKALTEIAQVQHNKLKCMRNNVIENAAKHMRDELIIGGIREYQDENTVESVKHFFRTKMKIFAHQDDILDAERGKSSPSRLINGRRV